MFLPIFIALLMGLISPANPSSNCNTGNVQVSSTTDDTGGGGGSNGGSTGGNTGQNPPPKGEDGGN